MARLRIRTPVSVSVPVSVPESPMVDQQHVHRKDGRKERELGYPGRAQMQRMFSDLPHAILQIERNRVPLASPAVSCPDG